MADILGKARAAAQSISRIIHIAFRSIQGNLREMAPDQDLQTGTEQPGAPSAPASAEAPRPTRRSGRGHRGRGRRRPPRAPRSDQAPTVRPTPSSLLEAPAAEPEVAGEPREPGEAPFPSPEPETAQLRDSTTPVHGHPRGGQPASRATIQGTIEQVNEIIHTLKESLEQMDEVLELLEYFERQGDADEREIESLRRALRQLQRPRDAGQHPHRGHS